MRVTVAFLTGLTLLAIAVVVTLSGSPLVVARTNGISSEERIGEARGNVGACQGGETLPAGTTGIRLALESAAGPRVSVAVRSGKRVLTSGVAESGWTSSAVTVPIKPLTHTVTRAQTCFALGRSAENVVVLGATSATPVAKSPGGQPLLGRFTVEYMRSGSSSWLSSWQAVARHLSLGREPSGTWIVVLLALLMGALATAASWLVLKELR
jgi:hypothetical protein